MTTTNEISISEALHKIDSGEWKRIDDDPLLTQEAYVEVKINLNKDIKNWVETQNIQLPELLENLLDGFYRTQRSISKVE